jgi:hypothetical protein
VATGVIVTFSRYNYPKSILYHTLQLDLVQMWPHFAQSDLEGRIQSISAKMTLRLIGTVVALPDFSNRLVIASSLPTLLAATAAKTPSTVSASSA